MKNQRRMLVFLIIFAIVINCYAGTAMQELNSIRKEKGKLLPP